jgi:hypothetical protein
VIVGFVSKKGRCRLELDHPGVDEPLGLVDRLGHLRPLVRRIVLDIGQKRAGLPNHGSIQPPEILRCSRPFRCGPQLTFDFADSGLK